MATVLRAWRVEGEERLVELAEPRADELGLVEERLEGWLISQPDALQDNLLVIGRQVDTSSGPLDILCITAEGKPVIVELKRDRAPRESVAQAIDYASWVAMLTADEFESIAGRHLQRPLNDAFRERFGEELPKVQLSNPAILVVASRLDASTERMIEFLSDQHGMDIDGLVFRFIRLPSGEEIIVRASVLSEERRTVKSETYRVSPDRLVAQARDRKIIPHLNLLRGLSDFLAEDPVRTYGGSFRYWGNGRMLCGVNVAANWDAPHGSLDVWVSHGNLAQVAGLPEESLVEQLTSQFELVKMYEGSHQAILRIKSEANAEAFVNLVRRWVEGVEETAEEEPSA
jgi:hypothetical protein